MAEEKEGFGELMSDYPLPAFYFEVKFEFAGGGSEYVSFQEVSGLSSEMDLETVKEGGENTFVYRLPTQVKHSNLVLKRALEAAPSSIIDWVKDALEGGLMNAIKPCIINISLLGKDQSPLKTWTANNAYPVKWDISPFGSQKNELAIETLEFAYNYLFTDND